MAEKSVVDQLRQTPLYLSEHNDPDKHWIGETLAPPTQTEIAATVGSASTPGESPFVARADHQHKLGTNVITAANIASGAVGTSEIANGSITNVKLAAENTNQTLIRRRETRTSQTFPATSVTQTMTAAITNIESVGGIAYSAGTYSVPAAGTYAIRFSCSGGGVIAAGVHLIINISASNVSRTPGTGNSNQSASYITFLNTSDGITFTINNTTASGVSTIPEIEIVRLAS